MFDFLKKKKSNESPPISTAHPSENEINKSETPANVANKGFFNRLKQGLAKTRSSLTDKISNLFLGKKELNAELLSEIETILLMADVGHDTTEQLINRLTQQLARKEF